LLLVTQVVFEQLVPGDVARVHAGDRMVHQQLGIDLGDTRDGGECPVALTQIITPFREIGAVLLMFFDMPWTCNGFAPVT
jgi:hypothetical protein